MIRTFVVACSALAATAFAVPTASAQTQVTASCAQVRAALPIAGDGHYVLRTATHLVPVFCYDMATNPREYVTLPAVNFSQYSQGGAAYGTDVRTTYTRARIDPATLTVDINDTTFATSTGSLVQTGLPISSMPYGVAASCSSSINGVGRVDLTGTAFVLDDPFAVGGYLPRGNAVISADHRTADLSGGGYCGAITPAPYIYSPVNPGSPDFHLELGCGPYDLIDVLLGRACVPLT